MNPYEGLQLDLSQATMPSADQIDPERLSAALAEIEALTKSNLEQKAKWSSTLRVIETVLRSAGVILVAARPK